MPRKTTTKIKKVAANTNGKKKAAPSPAIVIDYPREGEIVLPGHYSVRIAADPNTEVQCSVNNSEWTVCRTADGFYWFDFWRDEPGKLTITGRMKSGKKAWKKSDKRNCVLNKPENGSNN